MEKQKKPKSMKYWLDIAGNVASMTTLAVITAGTVMIYRSVKPKPTKKEKENKQEEKKQPKPACE